MGTVLDSDELVPVQAKPFGLHRMRGVNEYHVRAVGRAAFLASIVLIAGCGSGAGGGSTGGRLSMTAVWQADEISAPPRPGVPPGFVQQLPADVKLVAAAFCSVSLRCCVKVDPQQVETATDHVLVLDQLPIGAATVALAGFANAGAPAAVSCDPSGAAILTPCSTTPANVGAACDADPAPPAYRSDLEPVTVVAGIQVDTPLIELYAVAPPSPAPTPTLTIPLSTTPTATLAVATATPTATASESATATPTHSTTPTATETATLEPSPTPTTCPMETPAAGAIVVFENLQVASGSDPLVQLANRGSQAVQTFCFYADQLSGCSVVGFPLFMPAASVVTWHAATGERAESGTLIPPVPTTPFDGELVCVAVDPSNGSPSVYNHLAGTLQGAQGCPQNAVGIEGFVDLNDGDSVLCLGTDPSHTCPNGAEYESCPSGVDPARIQDCWSTVQFTFECGLPAVGPGAPTVTTTPTQPPGATPTPTRPPVDAFNSVDAYAPAALLVYPYVAVDSAAGTDTIVQLSTTTSTAVTVACFYENTTFHCSNQASQSCTSAAGCSGGATCDPGWSVTDFLIELAPQQPSSWRAGQGSPGGTALPSVPAVPEDPFVGALRCLVVNRAGAPAATDALTGGATIEQFISGQRLDVARYNAIGAPSANPANGDGVLVLGDEVAPCPNTVILNNFLDGAADPAQSSASVNTTLAMLPCSVDYRNLIPSTTLVRFVLYNEFEQQLSGAMTVSAQHVAPLASISPAFTFAVSGTLTGQARLMSAGDGVLAVALEVHSGTTAQTAGVNTHMQGVRTKSDLVVLP